MAIENLKLHLILPLLFSTIAKKISINFLRFLLNFGQITAIKNLYKPLILQLLFIYNIAKEHPSTNIWLP
jgi:hypothetical protein